jgi:hypothetical protein
MSDDLPALAALRRLLDELEHARRVFRLPESELDRDHCVYCRFAWMANWDDRRALRQELDEARTETERLRKHVRPCTHGRLRIMHPEPCEECMDELAGARGA